MLKIDQILDHYLTKEESTIVESFKPKKHVFGLDLIDGKWGTVANSENIFIRKMYNTFYANMFYTFFKYEDGYYIVFIAKDKTTGIHTFGFKYSKVFDQSKIADFEWINKNFKLNRSAYGHALFVFNIVFYIAIDGVKDKKLNEIFFFGADNDLGKVYSKLMKNKNFHEVLKDNGYTYSKEENGRFFFKKN